jgi:hypothetical protein
MILPRVIRVAFVISVCALLAGCGYNRLLESRTTSPQTEGCTAERYLPAIENIRDMPTWIAPEGMQGFYSPIAAEILALPPISQGRCEIEFAFGRYPDDPWTVRMTITEEQSGVCVRHWNASYGSREAPRVCFDR